MKMKDLLFSLSFLVMLVMAGSQVLTAQVSTERMAMSRGSNDGIILELPGADNKMVSKLWPDWVKDNYDVKTKKVKKTKDEMAALNFSIPGVSAGGKVDMYSKVASSGTGSELTIWIATPDGYISPELDRRRYLEAEKMMMNFALAVSREQIKMDIEDEEDSLKDLEKDLDKLRKEKEKFEKDIVDAERAIEEARAAIERNLDAQGNKNKEIEDQIDKVEATKRKLKDF